jgi:hypothetical protein
MMHVLPCAQVREDLQAYHDGEVSIDTQVLIQSHLQECVACRLEAAALADLGAALRVMAGAVPGRATRDTGRISRAVLDRIHVEERFSLVAQVRESFEDMHLVWAGLGATFAMLICIFASAGVLQAARSAPSRAARTRSGWRPRRRRTSRCWIRRKACPRASRAT